MNSPVISSSSLSTPSVVPTMPKGDTGSATISHAYQAQVAHINTHQALAPNRFQLRSTQAKTIVQASDGTLKQHIKDHFGKPPVTTRVSALRSGRTAWGNHLKNLCKAFGKEAFPVPGHDDLYVAEVAHPTRNTRSILAMRFRFNGAQGPIASVAVPSNSEKTAAQQHLLTRRAVDTIENVLGKPTDIKRQTEALAYFVKDKARVASLPQEVRTQFQAQLQATRSDTYPKQLQEVRAELALALWECSGTEGRKRYADNIRECLDDKNETCLNLTGNSPRVTDQDLEDLHEVLAQLTHVTRVDFDYGALTRLPSVLDKLSKLECVSLHGNNLINMDSVIALLDRSPLLKKIDLCEMPIVKHDLDKLRTRCEGRNPKVHLSGLLSGDKVIDTTRIVNTRKLLPFLLQHEMAGRGLSETPLHLVRIAMNEDDALKEQFDRPTNKEIHRHFGQVLESELAKRPELGAILYRGHGWNGACYLLLPNTPTQKVTPLLEELQGALAQQPAMPNKGNGTPVSLSFDAGIAALPMDINQPSRSEEELDKFCGALMTEAFENMRQIDNPWPTASAVKSETTIEANDSASAIGQTGNGIFQYTDGYGNVYTWDPAESLDPDHSFF